VVYIAASTTEDVELVFPEGLAPFIGTEEYGPSYTTPGQYKFINSWAMTVLELGYCY